MLCVKDCVGQANHVYMYVIVKLSVNVSNDSPFVILTGCACANDVFVCDAVAKDKQPSKLNEFKRGHIFQTLIIQALMEILIAIHV